MPTPNKSLYNIELEIKSISNKYKTKTGGHFFVIKTSEKDVVYWHDSIQMTPGEKYVFTNLEVQQRGDYPPQFHTTKDTTVMIVPEGKSYRGLTPDMINKDEQIPKTGDVKGACVDYTIAQFKCSNCGEKLRLVVTKDL